MEFGVFFRFWKEKPHGVALRLVSRQFQVELNWEGEAGSTREFGGLEKVD